MSIFKRGMGALLVAALMLVANTAVAADVVIPDKYAEASEKKMMLQKYIKTNGPISETSVGLLYKGMALKNFEIQKWGVDSGELNAWCNEAAKEAIERAGDVDAKGQARMTVKALTKRCSDVFEYSHDLSGSCKLTGKKKKSWSCSLKSTMKIWKYSATVSDDGSIKFGKDKKFGLKVVKNSGSGSASQSAGKEKAMQDAAGSLGKWVRRKLLDIKEFQIHAPIAAVKDGSSYICLGNDMVDLDLPFRVVMPTTKGEKEIGLIKAREIYDGCVETSKLKKRKKKAVIKPMRAQNIIGSSDIKAGYTAWELPQIGLAVGLGAGIMPTSKSNDDDVNDAPIIPGVQLNIEQSLARTVGVSELHTFVKVRAGILSDTAALVAQFNQGFDRYVTLSEDDVADVPSAQVELGFLKRVFMGRMFLEFGAGAAASYYLLESVPVAGVIGEEYQLGVMGVGGAGQAGLGFQLSNRLQMKFVGGYRFALTTPSINRVDSEGNVLETYTADGGEGTEGGPIASLDLTWLI